jgi:hypothetical protein
MSSVSPYHDRLQWVLPDFTRVAWISEATRLLWEPRLKELVRLQKEIEWRAVAAGIRLCALAFLRSDALHEQNLRLAEHGLVAEQVQLHAAGESPYVNRARSPRNGESSVSRIVIGRPADTFRFRTAWLANDNSQIGEMLGYPECCRQFFLKFWVNQRCVDTTWPMALGSSAAQFSTLIEVTGPPAANILWRWVGVRAVPHLPCSFHCAATVDFAERLRHCAEEIGVAEPLIWQDRILSWPVEWSALHGIAEIKTPILKVTTQTDATAGKYVVRWLGWNYPDEGVKGLNFPYPPDAANGQ